MKSNANFHVDAEFSVKWTTTIARISKFITTGTFFSPVTTIWWLAVVNEPAPFEDTTLKANKIKEKSWGSCELSNSSTCIERMMPRRILWVSYTWWCVGWDWSLQRPLEWVELDAATTTISDVEQKAESDCGTHVQTRQKIEHRRPQFFENLVTGWWLVKRLQRAGWNLQCWAHTIW